MGLGVEGVPSTGWPPVLVGHQVTASAYGQRNAGHVPTGGSEMPQSSAGQGLMRAAVSVEEKVSVALRLLMRG